MIKVPKDDTKKEVIGLLCNTTRLALPSRREQQLLCNQEDHYIRQFDISGFALFCTNGTNTRNRMLFICSFVRC